MQTARRTLALLLTITFLATFNVSHAKKPAEPPAGGGGNGGGGNDGGSTAAYTIIPFAPDGVQLISSGVAELNDAGEAVGVVDTANGQSSYHLDLDTGTYTALPGRVWDINNSGEIVGTVPTDLDTTEGYYLSSPGADLLPLATLPGDLWVDVYSINDSRMIVGSSTGATGITAVIWRPILAGDGTWTVDGPVPLQPIDGTTNSIAIEINDPIDNSPFQIISADDPAVVWTIELNPDGTLTAPSAPVSLGTLDGISLNAWGINFLGDVCGYSGYAPFFKPFGAPAQALDVVRDTVFGRAMDINDLDVCVGNIITSNRNYSDDAYLWPGPDSKPINLEKLIDKDSGWDDLNYADQINNNGVIAGSGYFNGVPTGFFGFIMIPNP